MSRLTYQNITTRKMILALFAGGLSLISATSFAQDQLTFPETLRRFCSAAVSNVITPKALDPCH